MLMQKFCIDISWSYVYLCKLTYVNLSTVYLWNKVFASFKKWFADVKWIGQIYRILPGWGWGWGGGGVCRNRYLGQWCVIMSHRMLSNVINCAYPWYLCPDLIYSCYPTRIGYIMQVRRSCDRLIVTLGFLLLVRRHLDNDSEPCFYVCVYIFWIFSDGSPAIVKIDS